MRRSPDQLLLLDVPLSARGPARVPRSKHQRPAEASSLPLPFDAAAPLRVAVSRGQAMLLARLSRPIGSPPAPPRAPETEPAEEGDSTGFVLTSSRKLSPESRRALLDALADGLDVVRRGDSIDLQRDGSTVRLVLDGRALRVKWFGDVARKEWLPLVRRLGREHGLVEVD